eukprot:gene25343-1676_t
MVAFQKKKKTGIKVSTDGYFAATWDRIGSYNDASFKVPLQAEFRKSPPWVSDFRHEYLKKTGHDFTGQFPAQPPGQRSLPYTERVGPKIWQQIAERRELTKNTYHSRKNLMETQNNLDYWLWYMKAQKARSQWMRKNKIRSRGVFDPCID